MRPQIEIRDATVDDPGLIRFCESIGAEPAHEWVGYRLAGEDLDHLASGE
jgi:hypothetical protein